MLNTEDILDVLRDKDFGGSSLDEWFAMVKKDVISKTETQIVDGKKQDIVKEGKLDPQEKLLYKVTRKGHKEEHQHNSILPEELMRWWALHLF